MGFCVFLKKERKPVSFQKEKQKFGLKKQKNRWVVCFKRRVFLNPDCLSTYTWFSLDRTIWNKSRHYQFVWVCAAYLEYKTLVLKNVRVTGIWMGKN